jgi:hypothetical protein
LRFGRIAGLFIFDRKHSWGGCCGYRHAALIQELAGPVALAANQSHQAAQNQEAQTGFWMAHVVEQVVSTRDSAEAREIGVVTQAQKLAFPSLKIPPSAGLPNRFKLVFA